GRVAGRGREPHRAAGHHDPRVGPRRAAARAGPRRRPRPPVGGHRARRRPDRRPRPGHHRLSLTPRGVRVLVVCADPGVPLYGPSGASAHLRGVVRALADRGHEVRVAALRLADRRGAVRERLDVPVVTRAPRRWGWLPRRLRERGEWLDARRLLRAALADGWRPDLVWDRHRLFSELPDLGVPHLLELNAPLSRAPKAGSSASRSRCRVGSPTTPCRWAAPRSACATCPTAPPC